jgi:hypothetical protein
MALRLLPVPKPDVPSTHLDESPYPIGGKSHTLDRRFGALEAAQQLPHLCIQYVDDPITVPRGQETPIGRKGLPTDIALVEIHLRQHFTTMISIPEIDGFNSRGSNALSGGGPSDRGNERVVTSQAGQFLSRSRIPDADRAILSTGSKAPAVWCP